LTTRSSARNNRTQSERALGEVRLALIVLGQDDDLAAIDFHRPLGRIFEAQPEAGFGLFGVGLERTGAAMDQGDLQIVRSRGDGGRQHSRRNRKSREKPFHVSP
jgi:hypothetical protein